MSTSAEAPLRLHHTSTLPEDLDSLAAEAEREGHLFLRRLQQEWASGTNRFDRAGEALFAMRDGRRLVGIGGLNRDPYAERDEVGRVRRLYVAVAYRRRGVARALSMAIVEHARRSFRVLRLRTNNPEAARFYEAIGFERCSEADSTHLWDLSRPGGVEGAVPGYPVRSPGIA